MSNSRDRLWLHRYAALTAGATFLLVIAGALVTSNDAGLSVPDWPLSYGRLLPDMVGGIFYEHSHRLVATAVGLLTIGLAVWLQLGEPRRWVRGLGWAALAAVVLQGVLGGITVLWLLPPAVSIAHAALAQLFFGITVSLALFTSPGWKNAPDRQEGPPQAGLPLFHLALAGAAAVYGQLLLGAAARHAVLGVLPHVLGALVVTALGLATVARVLRRHAEIPALRRPAVLAGALLVAQLLLGLGSYAVKYMRREVQPLPLAVAVTTAHLAGGALLLAAVLVLALRAHWLLGARRGTEAVASVAEKVAV